MKHYDIFCKIVDNFGDIGVCWRLARQLQAEHGLQVRLWIDDLSIAKQLIPALDITQQTQVIQNITIAAWRPDTVFNQAADVVIEAFGCELPPAYLALMQPETSWINLEYLSAEPWVEDFHARNSRRGNLTRHFFFPGFTAATGGLLREHDIVQKNQKIAGDQQLQHDFFQRLHLKNNASLKVSLFGYPHAPIHELLTALAGSNQSIDCYVPASSVLPKVAEFFGKQSIAAGEQLNYKNLSLHTLPFLSQADYDNLLAICDINFVRGEDSWVRAIWAGKPFIWQPYWQTEDTHITKLNAFIDLFYRDCDESAKQASYATHAAWTSDSMPPSVWQNYLNNLSALKAFTLQQTSALASLPNLATNLVIFIEKLHQNKI